MPCVDLAEHFHSLDGVSIGEKRKHLNRLLNESANYPDLDQLDFVLHEIQPKNHLEALLKVEVLIFFRKTHELFEIVKSGDEIAICKILKQNWFIEEALKLLSAENFVTELFPNVSYVLRMKLIKRVAQYLSEDKCDQFFDALHTKYGLNVASAILSRCSASKVLAIVDEFQISLSWMQLIALYEKSRSSLEAYFDLRKKYQLATNFDDKLLHHIAVQDVEYYLELKIKYKVKCDVGRRATKKLMNLKRNEVLADPSLTKDFNKAVVARKLKTDFKEFFYKLFPTHLDLYNKYTQDAQGFLHCIPKRHQYEIYTNTFTRVFPNENIYDHDKWLDDSYFNLIQNNEEKQRLAEHRYNKTKEFKYVKYFSPDKSIPLIKERIKLCSSITERSSLLKLLFQCCAVYKDPALLLKVLNYFWDRHRNEISARSDCLHTIAAEIDMDALNEQHWAKINDIVTFNRIKIDSNADICPQLRAAYLEFLYRNDKPIDEELQLYLKDFKSILPPVTTVELKRIVLLKMPSIVRKVFAGNDDIIRYQSIQVLLEVLHFNKENDKIDYLKDELLKKAFFDKIDDKYFYDTFAKALLEILLKPDRDETENEIARLTMVHFEEQLKENEKLYLRQYIIDLLNKSGEKTWLERNLIKIHWENVGNPFYSIESWLIRHAPNIFESHLTDCALAVIRNNTNRKDINLIKKYAHLNIPQTVANTCKLILLDSIKEEGIQKKDVLKLLALLVSTQEFCELGENYAPKSEKVDLTSEDEKMLYETQCAFAGHFKYAPLNNALVPTLLKFCIGDYLAAALPSLYSLAYRLPEAYIKSHIIYPLLERAVSIRKHSLFLACQLLNAKDVMLVLRTSANQTKNVSSTKHLLSSIIKYFVKNPSDEAWELVADYLKLVEKNDEELMLELNCVATIPVKYKADYTKRLMDLYDISEAVSGEHLMYRSGVLKQASKDVMGKLSNDFCSGIVKKYFINADEKKDQSANDFCFKYLITHPKDKRANFALVQNLLQNRLKNKDLTKKCYEFSNYCFTSLMHDEDYKRSECIEDFNMLFDNLYNAIDTFDIFAKNKLLAASWRIETDFAEKFAPIVVQFGEELEQQYGAYILQNYTKCVRQFVDSDIYNFCHKLLLAKTSTFTCLMVLQLIRFWRIPSSAGDAELFKKLCDLLKASKEPMVRLQYNLQVKDA